MPCSAPPEPGSCSPPRHSLQLGYFHLEQCVSPVRYLQAEQILSSKRAEGGAWLGVSEETGMGTGRGCGRGHIWDPMQEDLLGRLGCSPADTRSSERRPLLRTSIPFSPSPSAAPNPRDLGWRMDEPSTVLHVPLSQPPAPRSARALLPSSLHPGKSSPLAGAGAHTCSRPPLLSEAPPGWCCAGSRGLETYPQAHSTCPATDVCVRSPETFYCAAQFDAREMDT